MNYCDDYVKLRLREFQDIHKQVRKQLNTTKDVMIQNVNKNAKESNIHIGDIVYALIHTRDSKLSPKFAGLYRVINRNANKATIKSLSSDEEKQVHIDHLKKVSRHIVANYDTIPTTNNNMNTDNTQIKANDESNSYKQKLRSHSRHTNVSATIASSTMESPTIARHLDELNVNLASFYM